VDGFRVDLASVLGRDEAGNVLPKPPVLCDIESDPVLAGTMLIAEAWDAAGLYQVGRFVGDSWKDGTDASGTTSAASFVVRRTPLSGSPTAGSGARHCTPTSSASPRRASTSSRLTTGSP
jgi:pullulanase/glycogen debranching enzyme